MAGASRQLCEAGTRQCFINYVIAQRNAQDKAQREAAEEESAEEPRLISLKPKGSRWVRRVEALITRLEEDEDLVWCRV